MTDTIGIIGPGRTGLGLALALTKVGRRVRVYGRRSKPVPEPLQLTVGPGDRPPPWTSQVEVLFLAVHDDAVELLADTLARTRSVGQRHTVLHLSGSRGKEILAPLTATGAALGSFHPLQSISDPVTAPERFAGSRVAVEGDDRAVTVARELAEALDMVPLHLRSDRKAIYHAAAVFASNYLVVCSAVGERMARAAGIPPDDAWGALKPLVEGTMQNLLESRAPLDALTGPVMRGDVETVQRHLAALALDDASLYRALAKVALDLARRKGIDAGVAEQLELRVLDDARARRR